MSQLLAEFNVAVGLLEEPIFQSIIILKMLLISGDDGALTGL